MAHNIKIDNEYAAILLIEILFEKGLINKLTYINCEKAPAFANFTISPLAGTI